MEPKPPMKVGVQAAKLTQNNPNVKSSCGASISESHPTNGIWIVKEFVWQFKHSIEYKNAVESKFQEDKKHLETDAHSIEILRQHVEELKQSRAKAQEVYSNHPSTETFEGFSVANDTYFDYTRNLRQREEDHKHNQDLLKPWSADSYTAWANGNQGYKWGEMFQFSNGTPCGNSDLCGHTVTIYGHCLRSSALGNIMFGCMGIHVGFTPEQLEAAVNGFKRGTDKGLNLEIHRAQYKIGYELHPLLQGSLDERQLAQQLPQAFKNLFAKYPKSLWIAKDDTNPDRCPEDSCQPCTQPTSESNHGGNGKEHVPTKMDIIIYNSENKKYDIFVRGKPAEKDPPPPDWNYPKR